ncbi:MAG TPA: hypothetical protein PLH57_09525 [Oligoflexia bacterium]|nr:hypothetical protein [Oligoflexia bacterium]
MKIKLREQNGISVLEVTGDTTAHDIDVLRAGLKKLLASGKNRLILDITSADKVTPALVDEIVRFHSLAAEHSGSVVLVGKGDLIREASVRTGSTGIRYFASVDAARGAFDSVETIKVDPRTAYKDLSLDDLKKVHADVQLKNQTLQNKVKDLDGGDYKKLVQENALFARLIPIYNARLAELKKYQTAEPASSPAFQEKIAKVEAYLEDFLKKEGLLT